MSMNTIYLIPSNDYVVINENINNILKEHEATEENVIKYDLNVTSIDEVINDLDTYNFLVDKKIVVCDNCSFLGPVKAKGAIDQNTDSLIKYLNNPSDENVLIIISDKLDERKSVVKELKKRAITVDGDISINKIIKSRLDGYTMDDKVIKYFIDYCNSDNGKIINELEKLKSYKFKDKVINYDDIDEIVLKSFNDNVYSLSDAILSRNRKKAITIYERLIENGDDINGILSFLTDQFRIIYNGRILLRENNNNYNEVASILGIHPYRFRKAIDNSYNYSIKDVLKNISIMDDMEIAMKTGKSTIAAFEIFIYSL